jgi:hypothetical protein
MCLQHATNITQNIINTRSNPIATIELWYSTLCKTSFAHIIVTINAPPTITAQLLIHPPTTRWNHYTLIYTVSAHNSTHLWTPMVYLPPENATAGCGYLTINGQSYGGCIGEESNLS